MQGSISENGSVRFNHYSRRRGWYKGRFQFEVKIISTLFKVGLKDNQMTFWSELRSIQAHGLSNLGTAIQVAFDLINCDRWENGEFNSRKKKYLPILQIWTLLAVAVCPG